MFIDTKLSCPSRVAFGNSSPNRNKVNDIIPVLYYIAMTSDDESKTKVSAENYQAYLNIDKTDDLQTNLQAAKEAVDYVRGLNLTSSTKMEYSQPFIAYQPTEEYKQAVTDISYLNKIRQRKTIDEYVQITNERAPMMGVGNCSDQAILAASYLIEKKGIKNVALIACTMKGQNPLNPDATDQHVFAVVGLDKRADLKDPETWGKNAVIVDPWGNISDQVKSENPSRSGMNKLYVIFRTKYMKFDNYAKYIDPTKDPSSIYNWENHRGNELN